MKHAIMVMGFGNNASVLQQTINVLDDSEIDFIIHWDKRYKTPKLVSKKSKIIFIEQMKVNWATDLQTLAEKKLFEYVVNSTYEYDYCHLISANDAPLMDCEYFKTFFKPKTYYLGFVDYLEETFEKRMKFFYPIRHLNVKRKKEIYIKIVRQINKIFGINRIRGKIIEKGCNWFSMDTCYLKEVLNFSDFKMFKHTFASDEFYVQTALKRLKPEGLANKYNYLSDAERMNRSSKMALRYIDWHRGNPFNFNIDNFSELNNLKNKNYAFVRKVYDDRIIKKMFNN